MGAAGVLCAGWQRGGLARQVAAVRTLTRVATACRSLSISHCARSSQGSGDDGGNTARKAQPDSHATNANVSRSSKPSSATAAAAAAAMATTQRAKSSDSGSSNASSTISSARQLLGSSIRLPRQAKMGEHTM